MTDIVLSEGVYGAPPPDLVPVAAGALQLSPLVPGATALEALDPASLSRLSILAPPGALERRFVLAHALRVLTPGASLAALAPKVRGGARLRAELEAFGCTVAERSKAHHRIVETARPAAPMGIEAAIAAGEPLVHEGHGLWTQPGIFSFDRVDPGTTLLLERLPAFKGRGADLGSGLGILARAVLGSSAVSELHLLEIDRRAVEASRRNVADERARIHWVDARAFRLDGLDFVVTNPPFHAEGAESRLLGQDFVRASAAMLRRGGTLHLVANRHLPYEAVLREKFARVETIAESGGYKIFEAVR